MPGRNGTGPMGMGPITGRGAGNCAEANVQGNVVRQLGCGMGLGRGNGRRQGRSAGVYGWCCNGNVLSNDAVAKQLMQRQADLLQHRLDAIKAELGKTDPAN
jgi:hypothetical protein